MQKNGGWKNGEKSTGLFQRNSEDHPQQHLSGRYGRKAAGLSWEWSGRCNAETDCTGAVQAVPYPGYRYALWYFWIYRWGECSRVSEWNGCKKSSSYFIQNGDRCSCRCIK